MSQLLILGNRNKYTFCNAIVAAQNKAEKCLGEKITEIYVIHSRESFKTLFQEETDWLEFLKKYKIEEDIFINRIVELEKDKLSKLLNYIKNIINNCQTDKLIIDMSNGTSEMKTVLSIVSYILDISNVYFIDSYSLFKKESPKEFLEKTQLEDFYKKTISNKDVDQLAYLNLTEVVRYKEKVDSLSEIYKKFDSHLENDNFFKDNLLNAILLKIKSDNRDVPDNTLYRISSTAIASSFEDLIDRLILKYGITVNGKGTLGDKIFALQNSIRERKSPEFDFEFLEKFNNFMRYLRNSTTHKALNILDSEKFKASLSMQMSLVFLEYYSNIVYGELEKIENKNAKFEIKEQVLDENKEIYLGLDGDSTGQTLEALFQSNQDEEELRGFSNKIKMAKNAVVGYINKSNKGKIIFAEGDDILAKGTFNMDDLKKIKDIYREKSGGMTCSVAYGENFKDVLFSMKLAKIEKNSIKGISIVENNEI